MNVYQSGNTVKLTATFKNWDEKAIEPEVVKFIVYDGHYEKLSETQVLKGDSINIGEYTHNHIFHNPGDYVIEWFGEIQHTPSLKRERIRVVMA